MSGLCRRATTSSLTLRAPLMDRLKSSAPPDLLLEGFGTSLLRTKRRDFEKSWTPGTNLTLSLRTYFTPEKCQWGLMAMSSQP